MPASDNIATAEDILESLKHADTRGQLDNTQRLQLAGAYIGLAAIKVSIETQAALKASMEED